MQKNGDLQVAAVGQEIEFRYEITVERHFQRGQKWNRRLRDDGTQWTVAFRARENPQLSTRFSFLSTIDNAVLLFSHCNYGALFYLFIY